MKEIFDNILYIYFELNKLGVNVIAISLTILLIDWIKNNVFSQYSFYDKKNENWINLISGLILSFLFSLLFFYLKHLSNIVLTTVLGAAFSVFSHQIMKAIYLRFFKKEE